jgi:hypothetical protein
MWHYRKRPINNERVKRTQQYRYLRRSLRATEQEALIACHLLHLDISTDDPKKWNRPLRLYLVRARTYLKRKPTEASSRVEVPKSRPEETLGPPRGKALDRRRMTLHFARNLWDLYVFYRNPVTYRPKYLRRSDILTGKVNPAKLYEAYANKCAGWGTIAVLNKKVASIRSFLRKSIDASKGRRYLKRVLKLQGTARLRHGRAKIPTDLQLFLKDLIPGLGDIPDIANLAEIPLSYTRLAFLSEVAAGAASFASVFTFLYAALSELGRVHSWKSALSYGMGLAYGYVALAMGKHAEVRRGGAHPHATDEQAWIRGLDKARADTIRLIKKGPAGRLLALSELYAVRRTGAEKALSRIWPSIVNALRSRLGHVQWRRYAKYRLHWPLS